MNKFFNRLGLAMRAGKVVHGDSAVLDAIRSQEAKLVLLAVDASDNTRKKFADKCSHYHIPLVECGTRSEIGAAIGKEARVVVAITDSGFVKLLNDSPGKPAEVERFE
jgi:ribosomal protein L7Ae-like RNA K-turn-binding protein